MRSKIGNLRSREKVCGRLSSRSGQAMVEVLVGLVALLVLIAGLLQVASLCSAQTKTMVEARHQAGELAMLDAEPISVPNYIQDWQEGPDGKRYTKDDVFTTAAAATLQDTIVSKASPDSFGWTIIDGVPKNRLSRIHKSGMPQTELGFVKGSDSTNVDLLPIIQKLVYKADSIKVDSEVWMTWTKGIY
jgi:hypothetical protein